MGETLPPGSGTAVPDRRAPRRLPPGRRSRRAPRQPARPAARPPAPAGPWAGPPPPGRGRARPRRRARPGLTSRPASSASASHSAQASGERRPGPAPTGRSRPPAGSTGQPGTGQHAGQERQPLAVARPLGLDVAVVVEGHHRAGLDRARAP